MSDTVRRETPLWLVIKNAHRLLRRHAQFRGVPLWGFVSELTGHGSTVSSQICIEFGWNPDEFTAKAELPYPAIEHEEAHPGYNCGNTCVIHRQ